MPSHPEEPEEIGDDIPQNLADRFGLHLLERRVLQLVTLGQTNAEIAAELAIDRRTVKQTVGSIFRKLHRRDDVIRLLPGAAVHP